MFCATSTPSKDMEEKVLQFIKYVFRYKKGKKVFEDYGEGIKYMTFDGKRHVFRYVGKHLRKKK